MDCGHLILQARDDHEGVSREAEGKMVLERNAGVEETLNQLENQDVSEAVEAL